MASLINIQYGPVWSDRRSSLTTAPLKQSVNHPKELLTLLKLFRAAKELIYSVFLCRALQFHDGLNVVGEDFPALPISENLALEEKFLLKVKRRLCLDVDVYF